MSQRARNSKTKQSGPSLSGASGAASKPWEHAKGGEGSGSDPLAARFVESLSYDTRLYEVDIRGSLAHAEMLCHVGLITGPDLGAIRDGLAEIKREIESASAGPHAVGGPGAWSGWKPELEDVHMCIEAALVEKIGDAGRKLHTGRSRNDQVALDLRLWLRDACQTLRGLVDQVMRALEDLAERDGGIVMPSYTHMQRAQPICLGGELMAWHAMMQRDLADLARLARADASPLGSGAAAGSVLPLDRARTAAALGFTEVSSNSIEATASRDDALDAMYVMSRIAMHLSRWAEQWIIYCTTEFGFVRLDERYTTGSSMMPQKRNPDMLELIRGRCGNVYGHFVALLTICKGLPIAYNRDLQEDKRHIFAAFDMTRDCLEMTARIVASATFDGPRIAATLDRGFLDATALAEYLVTIGVPFRTSHQVVGSLVRQCEASGRHSLAQLSRQEIRAALDAHGQSGVKIDAAVHDVLGASRVASGYQSAGNAGVLGYRQALARARGEREAAGRTGASSGAGAAADRTPQAATPAGVNGATLFPGLATGGLDEQVLIEAYGTIGRTLDDLPYTPEFDRLYRAVDGDARGATPREVFHRLHNLRKAGKLPKVGRTKVSPPRIDRKEEQVLERQVIEAVGSLGQRDQLPFTGTFDVLVEAFNQKTGRGLEPHDVWRLIAKLAK
ncbi:MAG: argininosuccinate lyase [Phycisphaerales bacterium]